MMDSNLFDRLNIPSTYSNTLTPESELFALVRFERNHSQDDLMSLCSEVVVDEIMVPLRLEELYSGDWDVNKIVRVHYVDEAEYSYEWRAFYGI